jgi:mutator protein MutT
LTEVRVAVAVIEREGRFLVRRRPPAGHLPNLWEFPGGKLEPEETWEEALVREAREELGVAVEPKQLIEEKRFEYPERTVRLRFYRTVLEPGAEPRPGEAEAPLRWVTPEELRALPVPEANREVIERLTAPFGSGLAGGDSPGALRGTIVLWALVGAPIAVVLAGMTAMAAENVARLLGTDLSRLDAAAPTHLLEPHRAVAIAVFVLAEGVAVALGARHGARADRAG